LSQQHKISPKEKNATLVVTYFDIKVPSLMTSLDTMVNVQFLVGLNNLTKPLNAMVSFRHYVDKTYYFSL
jgi:hypothetical protein